MTAAEPIVDTFPPGDPPAVSFKDESAFMAGTIHDSIPFWEAEIFPYLRLPKHEEDEIRSVLGGVDVTKYFEPFSGYLGDTMLINVKEPPAIFQKNHKLSEEQSEFLKEDIEQLIRIGAASECEQRELHLIQPLGVVQQTTKMRTIYDARFLNVFCKTEDIRYDSLLTFTSQLQQDALIFKADLKLGYYHVRILPNSTKYFGFSFNGKFYKWLCLPLGWCCSPRLFQIVTRALAAYTARHGLAKMIYLDDFGWGMPKGLPQRLRKWLVWQVLHDIGAAGFFLSSKKTITNPSTVLELLGFIVDTHEQLFEVPQAKLDKYLAALEQLTQGAGRGDKHVQVALLEQTLGKMQSLSIAIPTVSLFLASAYTILASARKQDRQYVHLPAKVAKDLQSLFLLRSWSKLSRWPQWFKKHMKVFTDACDHSYGFTFLQDEKFTDFHGHFAAFQRDTLRIHTKEHIAVQLAFEALPQAINDTLIDIFTDNEIVRWTLLKGSKAEDSEASREFARYLMDLQLHHSLKIRVFRVPTQVNVRGDWLSRLKQRPSGLLPPSECMLSHEIFLRTQQHWGIEFTIDACANEFNRQTERFIALHDSDILRPVATNIFAYQFKDEMAFVFPPFAMVGAVLDHLRKCKAQGVIVAPRMPTKHWWTAFSSCQSDSITLAVAGQSALRDPNTAYTTFCKPLQCDLIACRFDFK
jgi:hypothetical protein